MSNYLDPDEWLNIFETIAPFVTTATERRQTIRTFLPDMLDTEYSGREALDLFKQAGLGINPTDFYAIRRTIKDDTNLVSYLRNLDLDTFVSDSFLRISSQDMETRYRFVASYAIENNDTGNVQFGEFALDTNFSGTKQEILDQIIETILTAYGVGEAETLTVNFRRGYINPKDD